MNKKIKIYHNTLHVPQGDEVRYFLIITEYSLSENKVIRSYSVEMPVWSRHYQFPEFEFCQLILN